MSSKRQPRQWSSWNRQWSPGHRLPPPHRQCMSNSCFAAIRRHPLVYGNGNEGQRNRKASHDSGDKPEAGTGSVPIFKKKYFHFSTPRRAVDVGLIWRLLRQIGDQLFHCSDAAKGCPYDNDVMERWFRPRSPPSPALRASESGRASLVVIVLPFSACPFKDMTSAGSGISTNNSWPW
jgi:hypothetical protein